MVAGKVKQAMGLTPKHPPPSKPPSPSPSSTGKSSSGAKSSTNVFNRSFGAYFPRSSAQVQPRPPDVSVPDLLHLVEELRDRESRLKTELVELKLLREAASIVPALETEINSKTRQIDKLLNRVAELVAENEKLVGEREVMKAAFDDGMKLKDAKIAELMAEVEEVKQLSSSQRFQSNNLVKNSSFRKSSSISFGGNGASENVGGQNTLNLINGYNASISGSINTVKIEENFHNNSSDQFAGDVSDSSSLRCRVPRVPKPPPKRCFSELSSSSSSSSIDGRKSTDSVTEPPPPPPPPTKTMKMLPPPPPPPPVPVRGAKMTAAKVKRVPEVVEFYHSLMRRDCRRDSGVGTVEVTAANSARDLVGEIENRSVYLLAIKTDVETQGDFIRFLIKEVETATFTDIEDVVSFVKWLDDELSYLVDERAVLKHFDWPEQKADALREAAFEYSDLRKLKSEASSFRHDARQACSTTLKKMQTLLEKLEHGVYNLSRLRESATNRFKSFHIPIDWMLDTGFVSQIKLACVKLAMKYMKRVSAELEIVGGGPEEEELIVQGVRFAFRVHQFAGGFDVETMTAFEELRDKARSYHVQCQNQQQQRLASRSMPC
ncbi:hypothetical protein RND81_08G078600 [Saponaria officinalis]|uniref:Protein CHUP1, chloroplastic n=1 Tax=Saponaria officinalis TaxID=3572 RepID=A0AAW1J6D0_SAPOF